MSTGSIRVVTPARFGYRLLAFIVDTFITEAAASGLSFILQPLAIPYLGALSDGLVLNALYFWLLTAWQGRTLGKMALGIELHHQGRRLSVGRAFLREVVGKAIALGTAFIGVLWIAFDEQKRGWHDMIADTRAVRTETVPWSVAWEGMIRKHLTAGAEVRAEALADIPEVWRPAILREFARRYANEAALDGDVLRSKALVVEEF